MKTKIFWLLPLIALAVGVQSCNSNDALDDTVSDGTSAQETTIKPSLDDESMKFVGVWYGKGPYSAGSKSTYGWINGTWTFYNDGTYSWIGYNSYGYETTDRGKWHYNAEKKLLLTDSSYSIVWEIIEQTEDTWYGTSQSNGQSSMYTKGESPEVEIGSPSLVNIHGNDVTLRIPIKNYLLTTDEYMIGLCYANRDAVDKEAFSRLYTRQVHSSSVQGNAYIDITITHFTEDEKYQLCGFIQNKDKRSYSDVFRYTHKYVPEGWLFMNQYAKDGNPIFWHYDRDISSISELEEWAIDMEEDVNLLVGLGRYCTWELVTIDGEEKYKQTCPLNGNTLYYNVVIRSVSLIGKGDYVTKVSEALWPGYYFSDIGSVNSRMGSHSSEQFTPHLGFRCLWVRTYNMIW